MAIPLYMYMYAPIQSDIELFIVKAGCHPVAIAQVVEHWQLKSEALSSISGDCWFFTVFLKNS